MTPTPKCATITSMHHFPDLPDPIGREDDLRHVVNCIADAKCCSIVGVSNMGKSALMRALSLPAVKQAALAEAADEHLWVYVDCNRALDRSEQGFYELLLRSIRDKVVSRGDMPALLTQLNDVYETLIHPPTPFHVALGFNRAIEEAVFEAGFDRLVLCIDEFDSLMANLAGPVFLRLRALKDRFESGVCYVTATDRALWEIRNDRDTAEFIELFTHYTRYLPPLGEAGIRRVIADYAVREGVAFSESDIEFIRTLADGHPGLARAVCSALGHVTGPEIRTELEDQQIHRLVKERLASDLIVHSECSQLWDDLSEDEQETLIDLVTARGEVPPAEWRSLRRKHLVRYQEGGSIIFCPLFTDFVRRKRLQHLPGRGVRVDTGAGHVYVDGQQIEPLTDLEYRLLLLLYSRLDEVVDKYEIVEGVWGTDYIDEVDDSRIERLVSRLRSKVEPDPGDPRYIQTVRGRGYRLMGE
ncbi:MAG: Sensory transduction protein regX3 [Anaerolineales bacterium]|nr:Sensory transduction protein regX3 [Anaerolineales bacterium]